MRKIFGKFLAAGLCIAMALSSVTVKADSVDQKYLALGADLTASQKKKVLELLNLDEEDNKRHYAGGMSANRINAGLGMIISQLLEKVGKEKVAGLYTTGGDTMVNVCYQLGVECIEVMDYVIPQTDVGRLVGSKYSGLPVVGKGGLTGNDNTACDIVSRLFRESAR